LMGTWVCKSVKMVTVRAGKFMMKLITWVIANMILSIVLGMIFDKPLITAKRLIILLQMSMMEKQPP